MNAARQFEMQINTWLAQQEQARTLGLEEAIRDAAGIHNWFLDMLAGIDPDDLATVTQGRVTCPPEHRAVLRDLIARPMALEPGMVVPWRLTGSLAPSLRWVQRTPVSPLPPAPWPLVATLLTTFLASAKRHAHTSAWRWRIVRDDELKALVETAAIGLMRVGLQSRLGFVFAPPDAQEQDAARRITETERGFQRLADSKVQTHALLTRVMR